MLTLYVWIHRLLGAGVQRSYTLRGPGDNPEMESLFGRFIMENRSLILAAESLVDLRTMVRIRIRYHNRVRRHSSPKIRPPQAIIQDFYRDREAAQ